MCVAAILLLMLAAPVAQAKPTWKEGCEECPPGKGVGRTLSAVEDTSLDQDDAPVEETTLPPGQQKQRDDDGDDADGDGGPRGLGKGLSKNKHAPDDPDEDPATGDLPDIPDANDPETDQPDEEGTDRPGGDTGDGGPEADLPGPPRGPPGDPKAPRRDPGPEAPPGSPGDDAGEDLSAPPPTTAVGGAPPPVTATPPASLPPVQADPLLPPIAYLELQRRFVEVGDEVLMDASNAYSPLGIPLATYRFQLPDGAWTPWQESPFYAFVAQEAGTFSLAVQVNDADGRVSLNQGTTILHVVDPQSFFGPRALPSEAVPAPSALLPLALICAALGRRLLIRPPGS